MLCWCPFSNTNYRTDNFRGKWKGIISAPHPIFYSDFDSLLQRSAELASGQLSPQEARLTFLALIYKTGLVEFAAPADPDPATVLLNSEALLRFINWYRFLSAPTLKLPRFVVRSATRKLNNVEHWIEQLFEAKLAWETRNSTHRLRDKLATAEAALSRLLTGTTRRGNYALKLAAWAMDAGQVPDALRADWTKLFCLQGIELYSADFTLADFSEMREHMEENLPVYNAPVYANAVLHHVRQLEDIRARGLDYWLGLTATGASSSAEAEENNFSFIDGSIEANNVDVIINTYGSDLQEQPVQSSYPSKIAFLRANAAWQLLKAQRAQADELMRKQLALEQQETLDSINNTEDAMEAVEADIENITSRIQQELENEE